jgi:hypothetical protein
MEAKKENVAQTPNNTQTQTQIPHNHANCHCHQQTQNIVDFKNDEKGPRRQKLFAKIFFVPAIMLKIFSSYVLYIKYYCKDLRNETDINYSRFAITIFALWLYISYFMSILTLPEQTNVNKYTSLNKEKCNKKEITKLNQSFIMCQYCNRVKFARTSHCRVCKTCISFRDHHCVFINNCIGFNNVQYFVSFLFWGSYAIIFDMYAYLSFTYLQLSKTVRIISLIDFGGNVFFLSNIVSILIRTLITIYANRTFIESQKNFNVEEKCPFYDCYKRSNKFKVNNTYNLGFLTHFYYLIGPTLLHFFLPINKFKKYTLNENCQVFCPAKNPDAIQMLKYFWKDDEKYYDDNILKTSEPDEYLKLCHQYYDGYNII